MVAVVRKSKIVISVLAPIFLRRMIVAPFFPFIFLSGKVVLVGFNIEYRLQFLLYFMDAPS